MPERTEGKYFGELVNSQNLNKIQTIVEIIYLSNTLIELIIPIDSIVYSLLGIATPRNNDILFLLQEKTMVDCIITGETNRIEHYSDFHGIFIYQENRIQFHFKKHNFEREPVEYYFSGNRF